MLVQIMEGSGCKSKQKGRKNGTKRMGDEKEEEQEEEMEKKRKSNLPWSQGPPSPLAPGAKSLIHQPSGALEI